MQDSTNDYKKPLIVSWVMMAAFACCVMSLLIGVVLVNISGNNLQASTTTENGWHNFYRSWDIWYYVSCYDGIRDIFNQAQKCLREV